MQECVTSNVLDIESVLRTRNSDMVPRILVDKFHLCPMIGAIVCTLMLLKRLSQEIY